MGHLPFIFAKVKYVSIHRGLLIFYSPFFLFLFFFMTMCCQYCRSLNKVCSCWIFERLDQKVGLFITTISTYFKLCRWLLLEQLLTITAFYVLKSCQLLLLQLHLAIIEFFNIFLKVVSINFCNYISQLHLFQLLLIVVIFVVANCFFAFQLLLQRL